MKCYKILTELCLYIFQIEWNFLFQLITVALCAGVSSADLAREGRQKGDTKVQGGIDFTGCQNDPKTGFCCIEKDEEITSLQKDPILECKHKNIEKCHYTYVTQFDTAQEEVCEEIFEKSCQVTFKQQAFNETVKKCYKPIEKVCDGSGPKQCKTVYESACTTRYIEKQPGKFVGDTNCEKLPIEICGSGCTTNEGAEECHDKVITSLVDIPEETCDLNPQKTCRFITKLVPKLKPKPECTIIPKETCQLKFTQPKPVSKVLKTRWCQDPTPAESDDSYQEGPNTPPLITSGTSNVETFNEPPLAFYGGNQGPPSNQAQALYGAPPQQKQGGRRGRQGRKQGQGGQRRRQQQQLQEQQQFQAQLIQDQIV